VSLAVGRMLAATYIVDDRHLPRGEVLLFGGDTAYPVATVDEIDKRLVQPWNDAFREGRVGPRVGSAGRSGPKRVLLGIPGNHDWYDGLDGFARLFRRRMGEASSDEPKKSLRVLKRLRTRKVGLVARELHLDEVGGFFRLVADLAKSIKAF